MLLSVSVDEMLMTVAGRPSICDWPLWFAVPVPAIRRSVAVLPPLSSLTVRALDPPALSINAMPSPVLLSWAVTCSPAELIELDHVAERLGRARDGDRWPIFRPSL